MARRDLGGIGGGLQGFGRVLLELWPENWSEYFRFERSREIVKMAYVIAEPCIGTKDAACVDACPVDCIHPKKDEAGFAEADQLFIDPVECIDCGACVPVCPVSAIYAADDLPEKWADYLAKNAAHFGR
jgi:NAD-dependent dihydropyrimidine dehydrogenase PreA subunit